MIAVDSPATVSPWQECAAGKPLMSSTSVMEHLESWGPGSQPGLKAVDALAYCRKLTLGHYENFPVLSGLVPDSVRDGASAVYAFCRWADDLGDEVGDRDRSLELLDWWREETLRCFRGEASHPVFVALDHLMERYQFNPEPFLDLIDAFIQDQTVTRYESWEQLIDYCRRSADPVGRLVLRLVGQDDDPEMLEASDAVCTALQLTNHWQDVKRDLLERDRIYVPSEVHEIDNFDQRMRQTVILGHAPDTEFYGEWQVMMKGLVKRTWPGFERIEFLLGRLSPDVRPMVWLFAAGGSHILRRIEQINYETVLFRPRLTALTKLNLVLSARRSVKGVGG